MSLVSLGSCLFTINSAFAFLNGPMSWDASRVSAAIPSGVGFLGAGLIFKKEEKNDNGDSNHVVHGLTTAASLWLSAAVGIACGGDLFMPASFGVAIMLLLLRFGPRAADHDEDENEENGDDVELSWKKNDDRGAETPPLNNVITTKNTRSGSLDRSSRNEQDYATITSPSGAINDEMASLTSSVRAMTQTDRSANEAKKRKSRRSQAALASVV
jgi:putative Mg2+ transporter-C (MgtC) family protein